MHSTNFSFDGMTEGRHKGMEMEMVIGRYHGLAATRERLGVTRYEF
jgi:hypothetical protein